MPNDGVSGPGQSLYRKGFWQLIKLSFGIVWDAA